MADRNARSALGLRRKIGTGALENLRAAVERWMARPCIRPIATELVHSLSITPPDDEATCDAHIYRAINERIRAKCDIVINNSTGGGVNGDMVQQGANGYWEILWEERLKGMDVGAEMCTLDATTIIASFGGRELLMHTSQRAVAS